MKNKNIFLKNVLATASTLAITLISTDAMAAAPAAQLRVLTNAAPARLALDTTTGDLAGAQNNDALQLVQDGTTLEVIAAGGTSINKINGIDVNGKTGAQLEAGAQTFILGSVVNTVNNEKLAVQFTANTKGLILTGLGAGVAANSYDALGDIDYNDNDLNLSIVIDSGAAVNISSNIDNKGANVNTGKILVGKGLTTFSGDIGATNSLSSITIKNQQAAIFSGAIVKARDIVIGGANGGLITFGNGTAAGTDIVSENGISGAADATLTANANVIKIQDNATLNAEVLGHINAIEIGAASQLKVTDKAINAGAAITLADAAARVIFTSDNYVVNPTINGATADDQGIIEVAATDVTFTNSIGDANAINTLVVNDTKSAIFSGATVNAETITIGGANGGLITFGNGTVGQTTNIVSTNGISGAADATLAGNANVIKIQGNATLNADVVGANINLIEIQNGSKLIVNNKAIHAAARIKTAVGDEGELVLVNVNTHSNIAEVGAKLKTVTLDNLEAGAATALANEVHAVTLDLTNNTQLIINDKIKSDTVTNSNGVGKLVVQGADADVDFNIGTAAQYVDIDFATKHDLNIFNNRIVYGNLTGAAQGDLNLAGANSEFILKDNGTAGVIKGAGIFRTAGNATFGNIGFAGVGNSIALFEMQGAAGTLVTANTADIHAAAMTQGAQTLRLTQDLTIHGAYTANGSTVNLNTHDMTFNGHAEFTGSRIEIGEKTVTFANTSEFKGNNVITLDFHEANRTLGAVERTGAPMTIAAGVGIEIQINIVNGALPTALPAGTADSDIVFIDTGITRANATFADADAAVRITVGGNPLINTAGWAKTDDVGTLRFTPLPVAAPGAGAPLVPGAGAPTADAVNKALATFGIDIKALETKFAAFQQAADNMESGPEYDKLVAEAAEALKDAILNNNNVPADKKAVLQGAMIQGIVDENNKFPLQYNTVQFDAIVHTLYDATKTDVSTARIEHMLNNSNNFAQSALIAAADTAVTREDKQHKTVAATALAVAQHATAAVSSAVTNATTRLVSVSPTMSAPMNVPGVDPVKSEASAAGMAAGDSYDKFGAWAQINGGVANQKARKGASGFKSNMVGSMIGVDTMVNDRTILGVAFGNIINNVKQKDIQAGDKTRSTSWVFSGYGNYQFDDNWFIRGAAAYTKTAVDNKDLRVVTVNQKGIARGKYNIHSFGGELTVGKAFRMQNDLVMTPSLGARFAHTGKISYQETGGTRLNNKISQGATNSAQAVAGLQLTKSFARNNMIITPEAHANVAYGLGVKTPKGTYFSEMDSATVAYRGNKPGRVSSTIGVGITAASGSVEYGVGYDANIAAGYLGHQGSLKLKVKF